MSYYYLKLHITDDSLACRGATETPSNYLANSIGIIDAGYRGSFPLLVTLVETEEELGVTERGDGGFGSTGI